MKQCKECYNYNKQSCPLYNFNDLDRLKTRMYIVDCWCDEHDVERCELYGCGNVEVDE